ncbi:TetR/AcrR family transcriptional regulator [Brevibacillus centrosporus]|uniref:TetR/AcrR family transcriptional regulator n=1 Tax=Brevibacillus centrosporus TaxID=54910 RepID=UPI000F0A18E3|nr:TetR/AcrR family transcriptional regulator [Brevibacillus centrosporus]MEC2131451.1 TetR/AcrR family transcriptional regulator [Brevibacillus centrosporus]RNB72522.1 TetR/AcrR family transcriptional regulator [Brevibacillus centrosporus]GED31113.1 putative HTH-type transcriptional regulator YdgC [Brevibacillus centrosporus]
MTQAKVRKGEMSRARLLQAAASEFAAKGYHRTRVSDIVRQAGLTQAAFYLYFESKELLYQELMDRFFKKLWELSDAGRKVTPLKSHEVQSRLKENLLDLFRFFMEMPELTTIVLTQAEGEDLHRRLAGIVADNLRRNQEAGHVKANLSVEVTAESIVAMLHRLTIRFLLTGEKTAEQLADEAVALLAGGMLQA